MRRDIVVIGGSAGCLDPLQTIVKSLPKDFPGSMFVVVHMSADYVSVLHKILGRAGELPASQPADGETIRPGRIYVARPDHHLTLENGIIRVQRGPRENRHRPAIDPLFRTAAREYGPRVIAVLLSGLLDDGAAGILAVRGRGGVAIVQDPDDAKWNEMPRRALRYAGADYILNSEDIGRHLLALTKLEDQGTMTKRRLEKVSGRSPGNGDYEGNLEVTKEKESEGEPSVFACPECHGVLWELKENEVLRFRCRVGHSFGPESLSKEFSHSAEAALWAAMRALEEKAAMQKRIADSVGVIASVAKRLRDQSESDTASAKVIRDMIFQRDEKLEEEEARPGGAESSDRAAS